MFLFERTYLCLGCFDRFKKQDTRFIYKRNCICNNCFGKFEPFSENALFPASEGIEFVAPVFNYRGVYRDIFLQFKFKGSMAAGRLLGKAIEHSFAQKDALAGYDYIVTVPISKKRLMERGYNQSDILAEYVSSAVGIPVKNVLVRVRHTKPQSKAQSIGRNENVKNAFEAVCSVEGKNIIIFDDIYTTGSTMRECAKVLYKAGAERVCAVAGAYVYREDIDYNIHRFL